ADFQKNADKAVSDWTDRLMKSTAWGEHRARYWLDAARYGDTHGLHFDNYREMWPYRDWVIRAFNANQPFDEFVVEQIAGDLLPNPTDEQRIATGFQRCNITTNEGGTIDEENLALYATDRVQTFGWVFLGLTTNCGQCHNHKFDPFTMKDFYSLAAFFRNTTQPAKDGNVKDGRGPALMVPLEEDRARWNAVQDELPEAEAAQQARKQDAKSDYETWLAGVSIESLTKSLPTEGLIVHLPLDEGQGNKLRMTGTSSQELNVSGTLDWIKDGKLGAAPVIKPGSTAEVGDVADFARDQAFSVGAWIRIENAGAGAAIIARMDEDKAFRGWDLWQQGRSLAMHFIDTWPSNALKVTTHAEVLTPKQWHHVLASYDGSAKPEGIKLFVDGKEVPHRVESNTLASDATTQSTTPLRLGQRSRTAGFHGAIQDARIYDRSLETPEVGALAKFGPLKSMLATTEGAQRTDEQNKLLYEHYLSTADQKYIALTKHLTDLQAELAAIRARGAVTHIQEERKDSQPMAYILTRGEYDRPGEQVFATTPEALHPMPEGAPGNRLGLGKWLVDSKNPLTARVTVNRFWQQVFGQGIVVTPEDFGVMGAPPTHPELLDWLAIEFQQNGWNVKEFFKLILTSATYRQAAIATAEKLEKDRHNVLLSRGPRFRMDAEMVRDYMLSASGLLSAKMYGPSVRPYQPEGIWDIVGLPGGDTRNYVQDKGENLYRRSLYTFWKRMAPPPNLEAFNAPSREVCTVRRERTNTPLQALVTLNDTQFVEAARHLAERAITAAGDGEPLKSASNFIAQQVLCRSLNDQEQAVIAADYDEFLAYYKSNPKDAEALISYGESKADESIDQCELAAWTMVCNQIMNLDEVINK
ncbi:MAG: DUF1553 domain-containing protein, partial [Planctomycetales bacterium]|nr:DUF1553 domain-containing protein [Planctomycetales bacterium]